MPSKPSKKQKTTKVWERKMKKLKKELDEIKIMSNEINSHLNAQGVILNQCLAEEQEKND